MVSTRQSLLRFNDTVDPRILSESEYKELGQLICQKVKKELAVLIPIQKS
jgi:hypothetical protein